MTLTLNRPTLVLNRSWQPVGVTNVARALVAVWNERARVVDPEDYQVYHWDEWAELPAEADNAIVTGRSYVRVPEVIVLTRYNRVPIRQVPFTRMNLYRRDAETCQYCGEQPFRKDLTVDHVQPRSRGGPTSWENCVIACTKCNHRKADQTPAQAGMQLRKRPERPRWDVLFGSRGEPMASWEKFLSRS